MKPNGFHSKCPECKVLIGKRHNKECSSCVCSLYGIYSRIACDVLHEKFRTRHYQSFFNGYRAGEFEAISRGWISYDRKELIVYPDLNRVLNNLDWIPDWQIFVAPGTLPGFVTGREIFDKLKDNPLKIKSSRSVKRQQRR